MTTIPADTLRRRRIRLSADLREHGIARGAQLWLRVDSVGRTLAFVNAAELAARDTTDWQRQEVTLLVSAHATQLAFGVSLRGRGEISARHLRLDAGPVIRPGSPLAPAAARELDSALALIETHWLWHDTIATWKGLEGEARAAAAGAERPADVYPAITALLQRLGDHHNFLESPSRRVAEREVGSNPALQTRVLSERVGWMSVPGYAGNDADSTRAYAARMHAALRAMAPRAVCGWVVDLRPNTGGNVWPMLAGLQPFLGPDTLGSFVVRTTSGPTRAPGSSGWVAGAHVTAAPPRDLTSLASAYVAVLTGPRTASSGEAVAIAFRGRPRTRSFGLPTAGLSTAPAGFPLPDGALLMLTTATDADHMGRPYGGTVMPDEAVQDRGTGVEDAALAAAVRWLTEETGCRAYR